MKSVKRVRQIVGLLALTASSSAMAISDPQAGEFLLNIPDQLSRDVQSRIYYPHVDVGGYAYNKSPHWAAEGTFFLPFNPNGDHLFYGMLRGFDRNGTPFAGNAAVGYRWLFAADDDSSIENGIYHGNWNVLGFHGGYDRMRSEHDHWYNQIVVGGEFWHNQWFFGSNIYAPFVDTTQDEQSANEQIATRPVGSDDPNSTVTGNILYGKGHETILPGIDAEVGYYNLWKGLALYGGGYYFHRSDARTVTGPQVRAEYNLFPLPNRRILWVFDRVSVDATMRYDRPNGAILYGGIRLTTDLSARPARGLQGIARHMVDPLRRREEAVIETYHDDLQPLYLNGHVATVKYVSTAAGMQMAAANPNIDIIGVQNTIQMNSVLNLGTGRNLVITGGTYNFTANGDNYSVGVGNAGELIAASGSQLINLVDGAQDVVLQYLTLQTTPTGTQASETAVGNSGSFSGLTLSHVVSNGILDLDVAAGDTGTASINNSTFTPSEFDVLNAAVILEATGGTLTINDFSNNSVSVTASGGSKFGIENIATSGGQLIFTNDYTDNDVTLNQSNGTNGFGIWNHTTTSGAVTFQGNFSDNTVNVTGINNTNETIGIKNGADNGIVTFSQNFNSNTVNVNATGSANIYGVFNRPNNSGTLIFGQNFNNNAITVNSSGAATAIYGVYNQADGSSDILNFNGTFNSNTINTTSASGTNIAGVYSETQASTAAINFNGSFEDNTISASSSGATNIYGVGMNASAGTLSYNGAFNENIITSTNEAMNFTTTGSGTINMKVIFGNTLNAGSGSGILISAAGTAINFNSTGDLSSLQSDNSTVVTIAASNGTICFVGSGCM